MNKPEWLDIWTTDNSILEKQRSFIGIQYLHGVILWIDHGVEDPLCKLSTGKFMRLSAYKSLFYGLVDMS